MKFLLIAIISLIINGYLFFNQINLKEQCELKMNNFIQKIEEQAKIEIALKNKEINEANEKIEKLNNQTTKKNNEIRKLKNDLFNFREIYNQIIDAITDKI